MSKEPDANAVILPLVGFNKLVNYLNNKPLPNSEIREFFEMFKNAPTVFVKSNDKTVKPKKIIQPPKNDNRFKKGKKKPSNKKK